MQIREIAEPGPQISGKEPVAMEGTARSSSSRSQPARSPRRDQGRQAADGGGRQAGGPNGLAIRAPAGSLLLPTMGGKFRISNDVNGLP